MIEPTLGDRVYVDSNAFIYLVEGFEPFAAHLRAFFDACARRDLTIVTSELTIAECLYGPYRTGDRALIDEFDALFGSGDIEIIELSGQIARHAAEIGGTRRLKLLDAIHFVSAQTAECSVLISYDDKFRSGPDLSILAPGQSRPRS